MKGKADFSRIKAGTGLLSMPAGRADLLFLAIIPIFLALVGNEWVFNKINDADVWFYYGHFVNIGKYKEIDAGILHNYYQTRLPYTLIGSAFYSVLSPGLAPYALMMFWYFCIIFPAYYIVRTHFDRHIALVITALLATDIFFIRAIGWQYVDNGVLAYELLSAAALTAASRRPSRSMSRHLLVSASAFLGTSMIFIHLGAAITAPLVLIYGIYAFQGRTSGVLDYLIMFLYACLGVAICQVVYGLLNIVMLDSKFFFVLEQLIVGQYELVNMTQSRPMSYLLQNGHWLSISAAVFGASIVLIVLDFYKKVELSKFQKYFFWISAAFYMMLVALEVSRLALYLTREGLYATFYLSLSYFGIGVILYRRLDRSRVSLVVVLIALLAFAALKIAWSGVVGLAAGIWMPMWMVAFIAGGLLVLPEVLRLRSATTICVIGIAMVGLLNPWRFERDDSILDAHQAIEAMAGQNLPIIFYDGEEDEVHGVFASVTSSFTEKAWWLHGLKFPDLTQIAQWGARIRTGDRVFVMSSRWERPEDVQAVLLKRVDAASPLGSIWIRRAEGGFWIHGFEVVNAVSLPPPIMEVTVEKANLPARALPSLVGQLREGERVADDDTDDPGVLIYGPYAYLEKGAYRVTFRYRATGNSHYWDIAHTSGGVSLQLVRGAFLDTGGAEAEVTVDIRLDEPVEGFETRAFFSGQGELAITSIGIEPVL